MENEIVGGQRVRFDALERERVATAEIDDRGMRTIGQKNVVESGLQFREAGKFEVRDVDLVMLAAVTGEIGDGVGAVAGLEYEGVGAAEGPR